MVPLIIGIVVFIAIHLVPTNPSLRDGLVARFGAGAYKGIFSVASLIGFVLIVYGFHKLQVHPGKNPQLWIPPGWTRLVATVLMLPVFVLLVASVVPSRIRDIVKHPMLLAIKLWALAHLLANGDLGSLLLFGSFLAYAIYDRISVKARGATGPLGDQRGALKGDAIAVGVGLALFVFMARWGHGWLIGVPLVG